MKKWPLNIVVITFLISMSSVVRGNVSEDTIFDDINIAVSTFNNYKKTFAGIFWTASGRKRMPMEVACKDIRGLNLTLKKLKVELKTLSQMLLTIEADWKKHKVDTDIITSMKLKVDDIQDGVGRERSLMTIPTFLRKSRCAREGITL